MDFRIVTDKKPSLYYPKKGDESFVIKDDVYSSSINDRDRSLRFNLFYRLGDISRKIKSCK